MAPVTRSAAGKPATTRTIHLAIAASDRARAQAALAPLGYRHDPTSMPGLPARLVLRTPAGRQVDVRPITFDDDGNAWQDLGGSSRGAYPADGLTGRGHIAGREVRCLTAALGWRHHQGYPPEDNDRHDLDLLAHLTPRG